jgi:hypothetical protein
VRVTFTLSADARVRVQAIRTVRTRTRVVTQGVGRGIARTFTAGRRTVVLVVPARLGAQRVRIKVTGGALTTVRIVRARGVR